MGITVGVEVEAQVRSNLHIFDLKGKLSNQGGELRVPGSGIVKTDFGPAQVELESTALVSGREIALRLERLEGALQSVLPLAGSVSYEPYSDSSEYEPRQVLGHPDLSERVLAQIGALRREYEGRYPGSKEWMHVADLARASSTHVHIGITDRHGVQVPFLRDEDTRRMGLALMNYLENMGPWLVRYAAETLGARDDVRRRMVWTTFTVPERHSRNGRWLRTWRDYEEWISSLGPRLTKEECRGDRMIEVPDLETPSRYDDRRVQKTTWNLARFSVHDTVEFRGYPSMRPQLVGKVVDIHLAFARSVIEYVRQLEAPVVEPEGLYQFMALRHPEYDLPSEPYSEEEWLDLWENGSSLLRNCA